LHRSNPPSPHPEYCLAATSFYCFCFTIAGAALRLLHLGAKSLWLDEPATVAIARLPWPQFKHIWWYGEASFQGAYFLLMRGWLHLGQSEAWIRLPSAIFAIASIPLIYALARRLAGETAALASAVARPQPHGRVLLAGSSRLHHGHFAGAGVGMVFRARRGSKPRARLASLDGVQRDCLL
jgi:hypothetical protein